MPWQWRRTNRASAFKRTLLWNIRNPPHLRTKPFRIFVSGAQFSQLFNRFYTCARFPGGDFPTLLPCDFLMTGRHFDMEPCRHFAILAGGWPRPPRTYSAARFCVLSLKSLLNALPLPPLPGRVFFWGPIVPLTLREVEFLHTFFFFFWEKLRGGSLFFPAAAILHGLFSFIIR